MQCLMMKLLHYLKVESDGDFMAKAKKDGEYLHCYIKSDIMSKLNQYVDETGYSKTVVVEKALKQFLENNQKSKE